MIEQSASIKDLAQALSAAQGSFEAVKREGKADAGSYSYTYADLASIVDAVRPILAANGLSVSQFPCGDYALTTQLMHESGQWIRATVDLPVGASVTAQPLGSAITYLRRYCFGAVLGIVTDADDDGARASSERGGASSASTTRAPAAATDKQLSLVNDLMGQLGFPADRDLRRKWIGETLEIHVASSRNLSKAQASKLIDTLTAHKETGTMFADPDTGEIPQPDYAPGEEPFDA